MGQGADSLLLICQQGFLVVIPQVFHNHPRERDLVTLCKEAEYLVRFFAEGNGAGGKGLLSAPAGGSAAPGGESVSRSRLGQWRWQQRSF